MVRHVLLILSSSHSSSSPLGRTSPYGHIELQFLLVGGQLVDALRLFKAEDKEHKSFQFMHCWNILRNEPKWREKQNQLTAEKQPSNKRPKANMESTLPTSNPIDVDSRNNDIGENGPPETEVSKRPMGKKKAKAALRRGGGETCVEALDNLWAKKKESDAEKEQKKDERYKQSFELEKERLQLEQKRNAKEQSKG
ncbi:hypothetical protein ACP70R_035216 [Stipagrostis hirtigluma subsp. patula]